MEAICVQYRKAFKNAFGDVPYDEDEDDIVMDCSMERQTAVLKLVEDYHLIISVLSHVVIVRPSNQLCAVEITPAVRTNMLKTYALCLTADKKIETVLSVVAHKK